jgi:type VI secretion system secreted protein Hcp
MISTFCLLAAALTSPSQFGERILRTNNPRLVTQLGLSDGPSASFEGSRQGKLTGENNSNSVTITGFNYEIVSPRDPATGLPSGRRTTKATIRFRPGAISPLLSNSVSTNEVMKTITVYLPAVQKGSSSALTITFTNCSISANRILFEPNDGATEEVEVVAHQISITSAAGTAYSE